MDERAAAIEDPRGFLARFSEGKGVIIDEPQSVPEWFSYLQQVVDEAGQMGKFILTGAQNCFLVYGGNRGYSSNIFECSNAVFMRSAFWIVSNELLGDLFSR